MTEEQKRKGHPATWAASSSRENSSNGVLNRQNFLAKSYEPKKQGVKEFLGNKRLCFQQFAESINRLANCLIVRQASCSVALNGFD
jgi:hypothetical protein